MDVRYDLPAVELHQDSIKWLWAELGRLMEVPSDGFLPESSKGKIGGTTGKGPNKATIEASDLPEFLESGMLGDLMNDLTISFLSFYQKPGSPSEHRSVYLYIGSLHKGKVSVSLSGDRDWVNRVRGSLDPHLRGKQRGFLAHRLASVVVFALAPAAALFALSVRFDSNALGYVAVLWGGVGSSVVLMLDEKLHPAVLIVLNERGLQELWYIRWARTLYLVVLVPSAIAFLGSVLWPK